MSAYAVDSPLSALARQTGVLALALYCILGLGLSALPAVAGLAAVATYSAVAFCIFATRRLSHAAASYLAVVAYLCLTAFWADNFLPSSLGNYLTAAMGALLVIMIITGNWMRADIFICFLLIPVAVNAIAYLTGQNIVTAGEHYDDYAAMRRFGGFTGHPNSLTTRAIVPLFAYVLLRDQIRSGRVRAILAFLVTAAAIFAAVVSGSRKSVVAAAPLLLLLAITMFQNDPSSLGRRNKSVIGVLVLICAIIVALGVSDVARLFASISDLEVIRRFHEMTQGADQSALERQDLILLGPHLMMQAPIFGHGFDQFRSISGYGYYSHNNYIELGVNAGVLGLLLYYSVLASVIYRLGFSLRRPLQATLIALTFVALDMTGVSYIDRGTQLMFGIFLSSVYLRRRANAQIS